MEIVEASKSNVRFVSEVLNKGGIAVFPTDTVYGMGVSFSNTSGLEKIYRIKKRDRSKPLALIVGSYEDMWKLAMITEKAEYFIRRYLPGPYTLVLPLKEREQTAKIGIRYPLAPFIVEVARAVGGLWSTSANLSGSPAPVCFEEISSEIIESVDVAIKSGRTFYLNASTVIDFSVKPPKVLRMGGGKVEWL